MTKHKLGNDSVDVDPWTLGTPNWKAGTRKKQKSSQLPCGTHTIIPPKKTPATCQGTQQENTTSKIRFTPKAHLGSLNCHIGTNLTSRIKWE